MKGTIVYKGKYGATRQYAHSLGSVLHIPVVMSDNVQGKDLEGFDYIMIGGSVYIGKLQIRDWLTKNLSFLQHKKIFVFIVCGTSPDDWDKLESITHQNIPDEIRNNCEIYFLRGRMIKRNLSWKDRILLKMGSMFTKDPDEKKNMLMDFDAVKIDNILPITHSVGVYESSNSVDTHSQSLTAK